MNHLFLGDNLPILRTRVKTDTVDLVYLDPPFASDRDYKFTDGTPAFSDTWRCSENPEEELKTLVEGSPDNSERKLRALFSLVGPSDMWAYLANIYPRLVELHRVLKPTGSIYLHCDSTASAYLRVLLNIIFGETHFKNEVIWRYRRWPCIAHHFQRMHDTILVYSKSDESKFHPLYGYEHLAESTRKAFGTKKQVANFSAGHRKTTTQDTESEGPPLSDVWDLSILAPQAKERTGYPTQKPEALLERILKASSDEGDLILDPYCGSGTTLAVAKKLGRKWIGIDKSEGAFNIAAKRLNLQIMTPDYGSPDPNLGY